jgi:hypothetical protein
MARHEFENGEKDASVRHGLQISISCRWRQVAGMSQNAMAASCRALEPIQLHKATTSMTLA